MRPAFTACPHPPRMTPFTYLIGWRALDRWYYGVRYQPGSGPETLWRDYFTSSKQVRAFRHKHGEPDVIQVRRTFPSANDARHHELTVLRRLRCASSVRWLNQRPPRFFPVRGESGLLWRHPDIDGERVLIDGHEWQRLTPAEYRFARLKAGVWYVVPLEACG